MGVGVAVGKGVGTARPSPPWQATSQSSKGKNQKS